MAAQIKVVEKTPGEKIPYAINSKSVITFDEELSLNLPKYERDYGVLLDVCVDQFGMLVMGRGVSYVAQVEIPERRYTEEEVPNPEYDPELEGDGEEGMGQPETIFKREPIPFDISRCTLYLWGLNSENFEQEEAE